MKGKINTRTCVKNKRTGNQENKLPLIHTTKNLFKSRKNTYNKRLATKIVPDWELKVVVSRTDCFWQEGVKKADLDCMTKEEISDNALIQFHPICIIKRRCQRPFNPVDLTVMRDQRKHTTYALLNDSIDFATCHIVINQPSEDFVR